MSFVGKPRFLHGPAFLVIGNHIANDIYSSSGPTMFGEEEGVLLLIDRSS